MRRLVTLVFLTASTAFALALDAAALPKSGTPSIAEFQNRRRQVAARIPNGVVLLHANSGWKRWEDSGFRQDANFFYLTGLKNLQRAILGVDGVTKESWLFVSPPSAREKDRSIDLQGMDCAFIDPGLEPAQQLGMDHVVSWDEFIAFIDNRLKTDSKTVLYLDDGGQVGNFMGGRSNPPGMLPIANPYSLWATAIKTRWPEAIVGQAFPIIQSVRAIKSPAEIAELEQAAKFTAAAFWAGVAAIGPGRTQRQIEGEVIRGGMAAGADAPAFWPWVRSGPYAFNPKLFEAFLDYHDLNREMKAGELVRLNIGFESDIYKGDFGRTLPVSGHFDDGQRETLDLFTGAYLAGVRTIRPGAKRVEIIQAEITYVHEHQQNLQTNLAKDAAKVMATPESWSMYTHGIDIVDGYPIPEVLDAGNVICDAPEFSVDGQGFYVEDMLLVTADGYEQINPPLPYFAKEIEQAMIKKKRQGHK
jgi:Xaa-Pro aminopeptidase